MTSRSLGDRIYATNGKFYIHARLFFLLSSLLSIRCLGRLGIRSLYFNTFSDIHRSSPSTPYTLSSVRTLGLVVSIALTYFSVRPLSRLFALFYAEVHVNRVFRTEVFTSEVFVSFL